MMGRLTEKTAFVTAAGQGIGRASVLAMAREGARVIATDIDEALLEDLQRSAPNIETHRLDVCDHAAMVDASTQFDDVDILFNCAGIVHHGTVLEASFDQWSSAIDVNISSMFRSIQAFLPGMVKRSMGSIINMASVVSSIKGVPNRCIYGATKAAVIGLTKSVAVDFIEHGIRCNAICPGTVESPSLQGRMRKGGNYESTRAAFIARQPMGRLGSAEEIAALVVYLASDESAFTTGQAHVIDGGWSI